MEINSFLNDGLRFINSAGGLNTSITIYSLQSVPESYDDDIFYSAIGSTNISGLVFPIRAKQGSQEAVLLEQGKLLTKDKIVYCGSVNTSGNLVFNISNEYYGIVNEGVTRFDTAGSVVYNKIYLRLLPNGSLY